MIIGDGLLARAFKNTNTSYDDCVIFASGVSNSNETNGKSFEREKELILTTIKEYGDLKFIYFSSVLAGLVNKDYYNHKVDVEKLIRFKSNNYIIFNLPQIIGFGGNGNTLVNSIKESIINDKEILIFDNVKRVLLDVSDLVRIVDYFKDTVNCRAITISNIERLSVLEITNLIGNQLSKKPIITMLDGGEINDWITENNLVVDKCLKDLNITPKGYTDRVIKKYIL
jgi:hypothetical protein